MIRYSVLYVLKHSKKKLNQETKNGLNILFKKSVRRIPGKLIYFINFNLMMNYLKRNTLKIVEGYFEE